MKQELAEQAGFQYIKDERIGWAGNYNASLPKFAELIVKECVSLMEWQKLSPKQEGAYNSALDLAQRNI